LVLKERCLGFKGTTRWFKTNGIILSSYSQYNGLSG